MARPKKQGMDYWPFDVDAPSDDKFVFVASRHGQERAWYVWTRLLCELYRVGCCYRWGPDDLATFAFKIGLPAAEAGPVIASCIQAGLFSKSVYEATGFLTSKGIQKRFFYTTRGRVQVTIPEGVLLIAKSELPDTLTVLIRSIDHSIVKNSIEHISEVSNVETPRNSKLAKSKPKTSVFQRDSIPKSTLLEITKSPFYGNGDKNLVIYCLEEMYNWSQSGQKRKSDWAATLRNWILREKKSQKSFHTKKPTTAQLNRALIEELKNENT